MLCTTEKYSFFFQKAEGLWYSTLITACGKQLSIVGVLIYSTKAMDMARSLLLLPVPPDPMQEVEKRKHTDH